MSAPRKKAATVRIHLDLSEVKPREIQALALQLKNAAKAIAALDDLIATLSGRVAQLEQPSLPMPSRAGGERP